MRFSIGSAACSRVAGSCRTALSWKMAEKRMRFTCKPVSQGRVNRA
jgi:hypothetical protein